MRFALALLAALCLALAPVAARADGDADAPSSSTDSTPSTARWSADVAPGWTWIGHGRQTGGLTPSIALWRSWHPRDAADLAVGGDVSAFGFGAGSHWFAVLTGPAARASWRPLKPLAVGLAAHLDVGRIPVCNAWQPAACVRFWGFYPAFGADVSYDVGAHASAVGGVDVRVIRTWLWSGPSANLHAGARFSW